LVDLTCEKLDYCPGGEVFSYLRKAKRFDENTSRFYAAEIVLILEFLHEREGVAYRDLKPENLLLDADGHIKLVDFGFAKRLGNSKKVFYSRSLPAGRECLRELLLTQSRGNLHVVRNARILGSGSHPVERPYDCC
jgi:serine/threonine protein kinase